MTMVAIMISIKYLWDAGHYSRGHIARLDGPDGISLGSQIIYIDVPLVLFPVKKT
jgi:hypothetical protein